VHYRALASSEGTDNSSTFQYPENGTFPMKKTRPAQAASTNPLNYPATLSGYERDSRVAEAILAADKTKWPNPPKMRGGRKRQLAKLGERLMI
jgi:hypothetical protein